MRKVWLWVLAIIICAGMGAAAAAYKESSSMDAAQNMEFRINSIEQRVYSIESTLRRLEQQMFSLERRPQIQPARNPEIDALRSELETAKARLREIECGVIRLDERTLSASAKQKQTEPKDPCRLNPEAPVRLVRQ
ncbi:MAG: hypothetical protein AB1631_06775 [Acidobacteriota bacterium]